MPTSATLLWYPALSGVTYDISYRTVGSANWTDVTGLTTTSYSLTGLTTGLAYEWRVRVNCGNGSTGSYSSPTSFTPSCALPTNAYESNGSTTAIQLNWSSNTTSRVRWREVGSATWTESPVQPYPGYFLNNLTAGATYEWQVQTVCSASVTSAYTTSRTFTTQCSSPTSYPPTVGPTSVRLSWSSALGNTRYQVRWRVSGQSTWTESTTLTSTAYSITGLSTNTTYEYQVRTLCDQINVSPYSSSATFTTQCTIPYNLYYWNLASTAVSLGWSPNLDGLNYDLQWRRSGTSTWTTLSNLRASNFYLTGLTPGATYEWQVRLVCGTNNYSAFSSSSFFTTNSSGCDPLEPNDTFQTATLIQSNTYTSPNLCLELITDNDWFKWNYSGQTYYILVQPFNYQTTGAYNLSLVVSGNSLTLTTGHASTYTDTYLKLYGSDGVTLLASNDNFNNTPFSQIVYSLPASCTAMYTLKDGNWNDPTVWSCGRLPTATDEVEIRHAVTVPTGVTGNLTKLRYVAGGRLILNTTSRLKTGP